MPLDTAAPSLAIHLFGPTQISVYGRPLTTLRSRKVLWLLALLTLRHDRPVQREWLAGTLWPDMDQSQAYANLRPVLSDLRRVLGDQESRLQSPDRLTLYLDLTGAEIDLIAFDAAIRSGELAALARAVTLYRGPLLEHCHEEWIAQARAEREQNCLLALLKLGEASRETGDQEAAIRYYQRAAGMDPWSDTARRGWMEALAQSGDSNAAMQVYRKYAEALRADPTAMPDEQTTALYQRLRRAARRRASTPAPDVPKAVSATPVVKGYLPHPLTALVGREDEKEEIADRLRRSRLVALIGLGGIGKTRIAIEVAHESVREYADGVWLVALESLSDSGLVLQQIAAVLDLPETSDSSRLQNVTDHLREKRLLMVLDNCEHLLEACAETAAHLLRECAGVRILATSREALGITGETAWSLPALTAPDPAHLPQAPTTLLRVLMGYESVQLFVERAQAVEQSFQLTPRNAPAVAQICFQLEGIPLAIELAAVRTRVMSVEQIAERLHDHLNLLTGGSHTALSRQQTLRATLDWSYALLSEPEQRLLWRLSIFMGGWTLEAAEAVCAGEGLESRQILDLLTALIDRSLIAHEVRESDIWGRYRLPEMVKQYAAERLNVSGEAGKIGSRHSDWCLHLAQEAEPHLKQAESGDWLQRLEREHSNLRAALDRCGTEEPLLGIRIANALIRFWYQRGYYSEGRKYLEQALAHEANQGTTAWRAKAVNGLGACAFHQGDYARAQRCYAEALRIRKELGDRSGAAEALNNLGNVAHFQGDYETVRVSYQETLQIFTELGDRRNMAWSLQGLGNAYKALGDYASARRLYTESLALYREQGDKRGKALVLFHLGKTLARLGQYQDAQPLYEESLSQFQELGDRGGINLVILGISTLQIDQNEPATAQILLTENLILCRELGDRYFLAWNLNLLGWATHLQGDTTSAQTHYEEGLHLFRELGDREGIACSLRDLGRLAAVRNDWKQADTLYRESLRLFRDLKDREGIESPLRMLAEMLAIQGECHRAVHLWRVAERLRASLGLPLLGSEKEMHDQHLQSARIALGEEEFAAAWAEGELLPWEQTVTELLA